MLPGNQPGEALAQAAGAVEASPLEPIQPRSGRPTGEERAFRPPRAPQRPGTPRAPCSSLPLHPLSPWFPTHYTKKQRGLQAKCLDLPTLPVGWERPARRTQTLGALELGTQHTRGQSEHGPRSWGGAPRSVTVQRDACRHVCCMMCLPALPSEARASFCPAAGALLCASLAEVTSALAPRHALTTHIRTRESAAQLASTVRVRL